MTASIGQTGFIGLGVMGAPMCRNLVAKSGLPVAAFDANPNALAVLAAGGVTPCSTIAELAVGREIVFLSLPGGEELAQVCREPGGLLENMSAGAVLVDHTTAPVRLTRELAEAFAEKSIAYLDAPVARTRAAAEAGTLAIMVGGDAQVLERVRPLLECMGEDITHCGDVGAGQVAKLMNNMVLFQTVVALAEALAVGRAAGVDGKALFETLAKGSADSFALRNHGMKAMVPDEFPARAFSACYALKDLSYALELAEDADIDLKGAAVAAERLEAAIAAGDGDLYFPVLGKLYGAE